MDQHLCTMVSQCQQQFQHLTADLEAQGNPGLMEVWARVQTALESPSPTSLPGALAGMSLEVKQLQQLAWEQIHLGHWKDVALVWRDLYALACMLSSVISLRQPSVSSPDLGHGLLAVLPAGGKVSDAIITGADTPTDAAFKCLDLGIMMGGPRFKQQLHQFVGWLERHQQCAAQPTQQAELEQEEQRSAKRQRGDGGQVQGVSCGHTSDTDHQQPAQAPGQSDAAIRVDVSSLPPGSLDTASTLRSELPCLHLPALEHFLSSCMMAGQYGQPAVITGAMSTWPALSRWQDMAYFRHVAGHRTVPVEVGQHYLADGWGQQLMTLADFIDKHMHADCSGSSTASASVAGASSAPGPPDSGQQYLEQQLPEVNAVQDAQQPPEANAVQDAQQPPEANAVQDAQQPPEADAVQDAQQCAARVAKGYLAQHPLFEQIPALAGDVVTPEYCVLGKDEEEGGGVQSVNAWFGPAGTVTPLHTDPLHNLLCQVVGHKYVRLYSPAHNKDMYAYSDGLTTNSSQVDLHNVDTQRFPTFTTAPYQDCVLHPGDMLYIPPGWWHFVQSCSPSFSVSFWWQ